MGDRHHWENSALLTVDDTLPRVFSGCMAWCGNLKWSAATATHGLSFALLLFKLLWAKSSHAIPVWEVHSGTDAAYPEE